MGKTAFTVACCAALGVTLCGCGSSSSTPTVNQGTYSDVTCGNEGGSNVVTTNNADWVCSDCGIAPCVTQSGQCYSCYSPATGSCYKYKCGSQCQSTPCSSTCGTAGGGTRTAVNNPGYQCTNCGLSPCVSAQGICYSCFGSDNNCYEFTCGSMCSASACTSNGVLIPKFSANNTSAIAAAVSV
mmetsp:Transcript_22888/g.55379  ORF Transcript_22888/g.55379 Transcript_22888/m.55379 type:complete len:184 (+) Transcript_22888:56-607(+)